MATFSLRPCEGREDIVLPSGKTTIGRGPFLGVSDKRVSRSHAVLEVSDGKLTVLPLHTNPTFYKTSKKEKFVALNKDEIKELNDGDTISLLPDNLCYEIICQGSSSKDDLPKEDTGSDISKKTRFCLVSDGPDVEEAKKDLFTASLSKDSRKSILDEFLSEEPSTSTVQCTEDVRVNECDKGFKESSSESSPGKSSSFMSINSTSTPSRPMVQPAPLLQKSRRLPSWLQKAENETKSPSKSTGNRKKNGTASSVGKKTAKKEAQTHTVGKPSVQPHSKNGSDDSGEEVIKKNKDRDNEWEESDRNDALGGKRKPTTHTKTGEEGVKQDTKRSKWTRRILSDSEKDDDDNDDEALPLITAVRQKDVNKADKRSVADHLSDRSGSGDDKPGLLTKAKVSAREKEDMNKGDLPTCPYGKKCYRKNPAHFREYSHVGGGEDGDMAAEDSDDDDDDDRPLCPYGSSCYRRNPQHKREFKHTEPAGRPKRKAAKRKSVVEGGSDEDGPNTYDYNDSFIDDNSDATEDSSSNSCDAGSDDSDWNPQDDDGDDEDISELITEARGFLRSKKMTKPV